mgnify:FL=1
MGDNKQALITFLKPVLLFAVGTARLIMIRSADEINDGTGR